MRAASAFNCLTIVRRRRERNHWESPPADPCSDHPVPGDALHVPIGGKFGFGEPLAT